MSKYIAKSNLKHNGKQYGPGDELEMDDAIAEGLVRDGVIETPDKYHARQKLEGKDQAPEQPKEAGQEPQQQDQQPEQPQGDQSGSGERQPQQDGGSNEQPNTGEGEQDPSAGL